LLAACAVSALLALLVYLNALFNPFVYDDHRVILENASLSSFGNWRAILVHDMTRPLLNFSYAVDYAIWNGPRPFGFHLTNVLLHAANVVLLFNLAVALVRDHQSFGNLLDDFAPAAVAMTASLLFAVHPALSQAVGYVSGRSEVLSTTWFLIAFLSARRALQADGAVWWTATGAAWLAALTTKETAVTFPIVLCCYDYFVLSNTRVHRRIQSASVEADAGSDSELSDRVHKVAADRRRRLLYLYTPLAVVAAGAAIVRLTVFAGLEHPTGLTFHWQFGLVELDVFRRYLGLLLIPIGQTIFHAISPIRSLGELRAILGLLTAGSFLALIVLARRVNGVAALGLAWFGLVFLPSALLVVMDRGEPMAEHRVYLASAGLFVSVGVVAAAFGARIGRMGPRAVRVCQAVSVLVVLSLAMRTVARNVTWSRPVGLWLEAAEAARDHWLPRLALGEVLHEQGRHEEALGAFRAAVALRPEETQAYAKLGLCLLETGRLDEATRTFQRYLKLDARSPIGYGGLGMVAMRSRDSSLARRYFLEALVMDPRSVPARQVLAELEEPSNPREALRLCEEIQQLAPKTAGNDECIRRNRARLNAAAAGAAR
jgi:tetratricopeptide (TPR) repeat protein